MDKNKKDKIIVTVVCIVLSIGLWIYITNVENKIRSTEINKIPVEIINQDSLKNLNLTLAPNQELYVNLKVEGNTSNINKIKKSDFKIQVDLNEYVWKKGDNKVPVSIVDYPISVSIKNNNTLTALIKIEELKEKTMTIESQIQVTPIEGYFVSDTEISQSSIKVKGPESLIDKVNKIVVRDSILNASENVVKSYQPLAIDKDGNVIEGVELSLSEVNIEVKINKGKSVKLISNTIGELKDGLKITSIELERDSVEIIGPSNILEGIKEIKTSDIDLNSITEDTEVFLEVIGVDGISIKAGEEYVKATVKVEKRVEKTFSLTYSIIGLSETVKVTPDKEKINVTISGYESEINKIAESNLKATLNLDGFKEDGSFEKSPEVTLEGIVSEFKVDAVESVKFTVVKIAAVEEDESIPVDSDNN